MSTTSNTAGAQKEFLSVYEEFSDSIFRFVVSKTSDREIGNDLMQETFTRAWDYYASGNKVEQWKAFLFRTAYNLVVDYYRKKRSSSLEQLEEDQGFVPHDTKLSGSQMSQDAEAKRVLAAIENLDESYREILSMRYINDLPVKEIAELLGLSQNVVSVRIHRGIEMLRKVIDPHKPEGAREKTNI